MITYFESDTALVYYDEDLDAIFLKYLGNVKDTSEFIQINTELLHAFKQLETQKFVADIRKMGIISLEAQNWVVENLIPGMSEHLEGKPLHHAQLIDPNEVFAKVSGSNIKNKVGKEEDGFAVRQFSDESELSAYLSKL